MAASKANYLIIYKQSAQVYATTNPTTALKTPVPKGCNVEDRMIVHASYLPDEESLYLYLLEDDQLKLEEDKNVKEISEAMLLIAAE